MLDPLSYQSSPFTVLFENNLAVLSNFFFKNAFLKCVTYTVVTQMKIIL